MRKLTVEDAPHVHAAIVESVDHLRPWLPWAANEPVTLDWRTTWISRTETEGIFVGDTLVGGVGLHDRVSATGRTIGYWVRTGWTRRGVATAAVSILVQRAFDTAGIDHVEIHHDKANVASAGVPAKLGFTLIREVAVTIAAPGECGIQCEWRLRR